MQLYFQGLMPGEKTITTASEYLTARQGVDDLELQVQALLREIKRRREQGLPPSSQSLVELDRLSAQADQARYAFLRQQPYVLVARCPYCSAPIWMKIGLFSLRDPFWMHTASNGLDGVPDNVRCAHLFCVDGALNLKGQTAIDDLIPTIPTGSPIKIHMAAEVPFVKPRVLNLSTMVAVVHSITVAAQYNAYPTTYFAERRPEQTEFCIAWARTEYWDRHRVTKQMIIGSRTDRQEYELGHWIDRQKLRWLDPEDQEHALVPALTKNFPYQNIAGRQHPYRIENGSVYDLPDPMDSKPVMRIEDAF